MIVHAENNFSVLNRMINICNRRRVRIRKLMACELDNPHNGEACFVLHTTAETAEKVKLQVDKLIEVEKTELSEGIGLYFNEVQTTGVEEAR